MANLIAPRIKVLQEIKVHTSDVTSVEFWGNTMLFTGSSDKTVRIWRWQVGGGFIEEPFSPLLGHKYGVTCVRVSPQGKVLASGSVDGNVILWEIATGSKQDSLSQENGEAIRSCAFSPNGAIIVSSDDSGNVCVWGQNKSLLRTFRCHDEAVHTLAFAPDSSVLLTACNLGNIRLSLFDTDKENYDSEVSCFIDAAHDLGVLGADFCKVIHTDPTDDGTKLYTVATCGMDHLIKVWRIFCRNNPSDTEIRSRLVPKNPQVHMAENSTIIGTNVMNAECVQTISAHGSATTCVRFNTMGTLLISGSLDKTVKIWDHHGTCIRTLSEHSRYVNTIAINNDSSIIASGSNDRSILIWDLTNSFTLSSHISGIRNVIFNLASSQSEVPYDFICPITYEIMNDPVVASDGFSYERGALQEWFQRGRQTSPMTNAELDSIEMIDNAILRGKIEAFLKSFDFDTFKGE